LILRSFNFLKGFRRNDIATAGGQQAGTDAV
jgi:hypothetical protein